jgi:hypothetical protein
MNANCTGSRAKVSLALGFKNTRKEDSYLKSGLFWIWWVKCILRYSPAGEGVEGTTPDTEDTKIDRAYVS